MTRNIDRLIEQINESDYLPPVHKEVLRSRVDLEPSQEELDAARDRLIERHGGYADWA